MITITRRFDFDAGHRVYNHEGKCASPHGHSYKAYVTATGEELDALGRIMDFSVLKEKFGTWIDDKWDHGFIWYQNDPVLTALYEVNPNGPPHLSGMKNFCAPFNPTAEKMAEYLLRIVAPRLMEGTGVTVTKVKVKETDKCSAVATL